MAFSNWLPDWKGALNSFYDEKLIVLGGISLLGGIAYYYLNIDNNQDNKPTKEQQQKPTENQQQKPEQTTSNPELLSLEQEFNRIVDNLHEQSIIKSKQSDLNYSDIDNLTTKELFSSAYQVSGNYYLRLPISNQIIKLTKEYINIYKDKLKTELESK